MTRSILLVMRYVFLALAAAPAIGKAQPFAAEGMKIRMASPTSAVVWVRLTEKSDAEDDGSVPGMAGEVRLQISRPTKSPIRYVEENFRKVDATTDYTSLFAIENLKPNEPYYVDVQVRVPGTELAQFVASGKFKTPPMPESESDVTFTVVTGQEYHRRDSDQGHLIYGEMLKLKPSFFVHTGDILYYDKDGPFAKDVATARFKWHRMYSQPLQREFHLNVPSYFIKDDHDTLKNDCWPGQTYGELTWEDGLKIFREQTTAPEVPYRTARWGKDLQVWLPEGREYRSPNRMPDGPDKTILGKEQFTWLEKTLAESDATFKVIVSATPIVGPDRGGKNDNHANKGFKTEGDRLRKLLSKQKDLYVVCGDRHWQYVSVDPVTGLREYSCGPTSNKHAGGWSQDKFVENMHQYLRVKGGFLSVNVSRASGEPAITFKHHAVDGSVVNEESWNTGAN